MRGLLIYPYSVNKGLSTERNEWQNTKDIQNAEWTFIRYLVEKGEAKRSRKQGEREKKEKGTKTKVRTRSNKKE